MILINIQRRKSDSKLFLSFLSCKNRYKETELKFFNQPFDDETFNLVDDILLPRPAGIESLTTDFEEVDTDLYRSRGRKMHTDSDSVEVIDDSSFDLFTASPLS